MKFSHLADLLEGLGVRVEFPGDSSPTDVSCLSGGVEFCSRVLEQNREP